MTKYKLAPIEATEEMRLAWNTAPNNGHSIFMSGFYEAMTAQCETVQIVDTDNLMKNTNVSAGATKDYINWLDGYNCCLKFLTQNGYKIVKVCND